MTNDICRFGFLSTASIGRKYWLAMQLAENCQITAVASRTQDRSGQFIRECQAQAPFDPAPVAYGSYEELLESDQIDAVYIPVPTGMRKEWVIKAAQAGKHVLAEKPSAVSAADLEEMLAACREHNVQYMDGVMFRHSGRLDQLRQTLDDGESVGQLKRICTQFSFCAPDDFLESNIRVNSDLEPLGCLGDLGWYTIRMILWTLNYQLPERVTGRLLTELSRPDSPASVPGEVSAEMFFAGGVSVPGGSATTVMGPSGSGKSSLLAFLTGTLPPGFAGVSASMYCSFVTENQQWVNLSGTKGFIRVPDFVLPFFGSEIGFDVTNAFFHVDNCTFNMEPRTRHVSLAEYSNAAANCQETNMVRNFAKLAISGNVDTSWPERSLKTQQVMDAILQSARDGGKEVVL